MVGVPSPFYTDPNLAKGMSSLMGVVMPDPTRDLRRAATVKTAYETREISDRIAGRGAVGDAINTLDVNAVDLPNRLKTIYATAAQYGLDPQKVNQLLLGTMANSGANEAAVTRAMVGAGHAPNINQGVTYADLEKRRNQVEATDIKKSQISAGATITAARIHNERPFSVPGAVYTPGKGYTENPYAPERYITANGVPFNTKTGEYAPLPPGSERKNLMNVPPGGTVFDTDTRLPLYTAPDRTRTTGQGPTLGFGADKQILSAIDERFGVVRDPRERERMGLKPTDRLPLDPKTEQALKTRAAQLYKDPNSQGYGNAAVALDIAAQEIVGDPANLEPGGAPPDERSLIGRVFNSAPPPQYRVPKKGAAPGSAADAMKNATTQPAGPKAAQPAKPGAAEPLPYAPDGKVDARRLKVGGVYDTPKGRLRWNGRTMDPAD